ncbi:MAG TPA: MFS transporter [Pirellulales bacterium]|nr:MFS transporter [Pirellulales bacterium]
MHATPSSPARLTVTQWLICAIAAIGFAFDIYELLMLPLIVRHAVAELVPGSPAPGSPEFKYWASMLFYVPAVAGGVFGLLGGYLTDRLGRRRVLTFSILLYAFAAFAAGFSTSMPMLLFFRCLVFIGVCVEFVAAVAWLAELFPDPHRREAVLGYTQAFSSIGGLLVALANGIAVAWSNGAPAELLFGITLPGWQLPAIELPSWLMIGGEQVRDPHAPWRYTLMSGLIPAIPLILIRPFLPESPAWQAKKQAGTLKRPSIAELFSPALRRTTLTTTLMFACSFGAAFGAIQQIPQIVPGLPEVKQEIATQVAEKLPDERKAAIRTEMQAAGKTDDDIKKRLGIETRRIAGPIEQAQASHVTKVQEIGGLVGRFALAILALMVASRRMLLRLFLVPGLVAMPLIFAYAGVTGLHQLEIGIFIAGLLTVAQFSFWGNYLPLVYPVHLRGTGESFAANIGGRLIGTMFFGITQYLATYMPGDSDPTKIAYTAAAIAFTLYLINFIGSFFLPEPKPETLNAD